MFTFSKAIRLSPVLLILLSCFGFALAQTDDIYCTDLQTGITTRITWLNETGEYNPNWSPCGQFIVHDWKGASVPLGHSACITEVATGKSHLLKGAEGGNDPSWSPDGNWIAFDRDPPFGDPPDDQTVYIVPATGGVRRVVCTDAVNADWAPDSKHLVFSRPSDGGIYTICADGTNERFLIYGYSPVWSPDGQWIAFEIEGDLFKVKVDPLGKPNPLVMRQTKGPWYDGSPSWSCDSKLIAFHSDFNYDFDIWVVEAGHERPFMVAGKSGFGEYDPSFSKTGYRVAFSGFTETDALAKEAALASTVEKPLTFQLGQNYPNPFNPVTVIPYSISEPGYFELVIFNNIGQKLVTLFSGYREEGSYHAEWNASNFTSGVYFVKLQYGSEIQIEKMLLVR